MAKKFLVGIDLTQNELLNAVLQNLPAPPLNPRPGQKYYDTTLDKEGVFNGESWDYLGAAEGTVTGVGAAAPITSSGGTNPILGITDATPSARGAMSADDKSKLDGVEPGATANSSDAHLLDRGNHTGTQGIETVDGLTDALDAKLEAGDLDSKADLVDGKVPVDQLPDIAIGQTFPADNETEMLALDAQIGDVAARTDTGTKWLLLGDPTVLADWHELRPAEDAVESVTGVAPITSTGGRNPAIAIDAATPAADGAMSAADKAKLDGIAAGATDNVGTVRKFAANVGGSVAQVITHNLGTRDVQVAVYEAGSPYELVYPGIEATTVDTVTLRFAVAPAANAFRAVVTG